MTKQIELDLKIGANFECEILLDTDQGGRTHRADIRSSVGDVFVQLHFETGDGIEATGNAITLTKNALETGALSLDVDSAHWVIDIDSVGATEADVRREARGLALVTRAITRLSEPTEAANASKLLTYSLNDGQALTTPEQEALQTKIGITGGSASAVLYTAQTLTAPQQTQALANQGVTVAGRAVAQAVDASAQRAALGLGTAATTAASEYATAAQGTDDRTASGLRTATTVVSVSAATAPSSGQVLTATGSTAATWQTPGGGMAIGGTVTGATVGRVPFFGSGPVLSDSANISFESFGRLSLGNGIILGSAAAVELGGDSGALYLRAPNIYGDIPGVFSLAGHIKPGALTVTNRTLAALNSAYPSPTLGQIGFITDESGAGTVATSGGAIETLVIYGNGAWQVIRVSAVVTTLTASGNIPKPTGARYADIEIWGGGGAGGAGRKGAAASVRCGGGGGSGGAYVKWRVDASECDDNLICTIPSAAEGAEAVSTNSTNGNAGASPANTTVLLRAGGMLLSAQGGSGGGGGATSSGTGGIARAAPAMPFVGAPSVVGASASTTGLAGAAGGAATFGNAGAGAGGGITTANAASAGGAGGAITGQSSGMGNTVAGPAGGAIATDGNSAIYPSNAWHGAPGASGGGSSLVGDGGKGGSGVGFGGAGAGGGAAVDSVGNSGAGGNGAPGAARVTWTF